MVSIPDRHFRVHKTGTKDKEFVTERIDDSDSEVTYLAGGNDEGSWVIRKFAGEPIVITYVFGWGSIEDSYPERKTYTYRSIYDALKTENILVT